MKIIILSDEEYSLLEDELISLFNYDWNNDCIAAKDCGSKALTIIREKITEVERLGNP